MIISISLAILFIVLSVIFLMGKGDKLIAGYNTASDEEKQKVNIHRLRLLMAILSVITALFCASQPFIGNETADHLGSLFLFFLVTLLFVILANTWAKKK